MGRLGAGEALLVMLMRSQVAVSDHGAIVTYVFCTLVLNSRSIAMQILVWFDLHLLMPVPACALLSKLQPLVCGLLPSSGELASACLLLPFGVKRHASMWRLAWPSALSSMRIWSDIC